MMLVKLTGWPVPFQIEISRRKGLARYERLYKECESREVEDVGHWFLKFPAWNHIREPLTIEPILTGLPLGMSLVN